MSEQIDELILNQGFGTKGYTTSNSGFLSGATAGLPQQIPATPMAGRKLLTVVNSGATTFFIGHSAGASGSGVPMAINASKDFASNSGIYMVPIVAGQTLSYLELG